MPVHKSWDAFGPTPVPSGTAEANPVVIGEIVVGCNLGVAIEVANGASAPSDPLKIAIRGQAKGAGSWSSYIVGPLVAGKGISEKTPFFIRIGIEWEKIQIVAFGNVGGSAISVAVQAARVDSLT